MRVGPHPHALPLDGSKTRRSRRPQALAFPRLNSHSAVIALADLL